METVQPIRNKADIDEMKAVLSSRDRLMFIIGINSALRISDLLMLKVGDVRGKDVLTIKERKTGKTKQFRLNSSVQNAVKELVPDTAEDSDWLFPSRKGDKPITRVQAYRVLAKAADYIGLADVGTHTMRKTFGYHAYKAGVDLATLQSILNHASQRETLRYIGITRDEIDDVYETIAL